MPSIQVPEMSANLSADGSASGYITVVNNSGYYPGCKAWLRNNSGSQRCLITDLISTDKVGLRFLLEENCGFRLQPGHYGRSDCSAYTVASNSRLSMPAQLAPVDPLFTKILSA
jgi:hypothetical protein